MTGSTYWRCHKDRALPHQQWEDYRPVYDMVDCRLGLNDHSPQRFTNLFDFTGILHGPCRHLPHLLSEHALAIRLYGKSIHAVTAGVHRLMLAGCLLYFYMLLQGRRYVDKHIPSSFTGKLIIGIYRNLSEVCPIISDNFIGSDKFIG